MVTLLWKPIIACAIRQCPVRPFTATKQRYFCFQFYSNVLVSRSNASLAIDDDKRMYFSDKKHGRYASSVALVSFTDSVRMEKGVQRPFKMLYDACSVCPITGCCTHSQSCLNKYSPMGWLWRDSLRPYVYCSDVDVLTNMPYTQNLFLVSTWNKFEYENFIFHQCRFCFGFRSAPKTVLN